ncbi:MULTISPECIES: disulfide bond formation protein DsbB [Pseudoalteromonas]|jgi:disulfide bond formation protein DsbB|uniref:Disulfide bond formation protein B n=2 Tax=Pseudoalteromonas agarivorans TaxID=176102 RepID=A0ABR5VPC4_9GAMM|nr:MULTISPECIES: disulfide bond formation protein DsbB [Pseudoalteromonas]MCP4057372.1 disulfide bond formation protein DsbB [Pseudoalteromonas sp.]MDY6888870.1 disulfide bond formation protein DsbB [Pseudomonadota bacterium]ATC82989.1 disulfide bond formation protein DsbB [Pseudoalteromonas agarivorans DSM 14585]ENN99204.1 disulfide oxidoreductase [Pseudoalteromonas agarivorans S816]KPV91981.1 Disulfide bond formation protein B [Pseudoalteromonas sp. P1-30]|tara:strand:- start:460 stop:978 length:519 start_codon:yes stop_codon:yes gene_type:complete
MNWLAQLPTQRTPWLLFTGIVFLLEVTALFFQYQMGLAPCIMCIYQRTAVLGLLGAGIIGATKPQSKLVRAIAYLVWGVSSVWGYFIAREHIEMQTTTDPFAFSCEFEPNFPSFMPLHEWIPSFFQATGDCGNIDWQFAGLSMPAWMEILFALFTITLFVIVTTRLLTKKTI